MKTRMVAERIGENMGPIDFAYDFWSHDWENGGCCNPRGVERGLESLLSICKDPEGDWLRRTEFKDQPIIDIGMYDGWPYWKPTPSVCVATTHGCEWHSFVDLQVRKDSP